MFGRITAVKRAGMCSLNEGQKISYGFENDRRSGKEGAGDLESA